MRTLIFSILFMMPVALFAQLDTRAPGIYAVVDSQSILLPYTRSTIIAASVDDGFVADALVLYSGEYSGVNAANTFVLVVNPKKSFFTVEKPFVKNLTPVNMRFLPLTVNSASQRREYQTGTRVAAGLLYEEKIGLEFQWEQITDNSYLITIPDDTPAGEYGFSFCLHRIGTYDYYYGIFGFTIPSKQ